MSISVSQESVMRARAAACEIDIIAFSLRNGIPLPKTGWILRCEATLVQELVRTTNRVTLRKKI